MAKRLPRRTGGDKTPQKRKRPYVAPALIVGGSLLVGAKNAGAAMFFCCLSERLRRAIGDSQERESLMSQLVAVETAAPRAR